MPDLSSEVSDPGTTPERLYQIAQSRPDLGNSIAAHPNCYPELRGWIAQYSPSYSPPSVPTLTTPVALVRSSAPEEPHAKRAKGKFWTRTKVIVSGALAVVGAVTGVISVIPILTRDATNFSHLQIAAAPVTGDESEWAIAIDALDDSFPDTAAACGVDQLAWLKANGTPLKRSFMIDLRNVASEGAMLALTDFRSTEEGAEDRGPISVRFVCDPSGVPPKLLYYGKLLADDPSASATHVKLKAGADPNSSPEAPIAFNLGPGESGKLPLDLFSRNPVEGKVQVTVLSRDEQRTVEIEGSQFHMPALLFAGEMFLYTSSDGLICQKIEAGTIRSCSIDELRHEVEQAR